MSHRERLSSRAAGPRRVRPLRSTANAAPQAEVLSSFRSFAEAMSDLAQRAPDRRLVPGS